MSDNIAGELSILLEGISAVARTGLAFSTDAYDIRRYKKILTALGRISELLSRDNQALDSILSHLDNIRAEIGNQEYVTPKVAVATATFNRAGEVLLVKRGKMLWTLPGGYADVGLDPIQNAEKEVREETGLEVKVVSLVGVYDSNMSSFPTVGRQVYTLIFYAKLVGGRMKADPLETGGLDFFHPNSLPKTLPVTRLQIEHAFRVFQGEPLPTFVDHKEYN